MITRRTKSPIIKLHVVVDEGVNVAALNQDFGHFVQDGVPQRDQCRVSFHQQLRGDVRVVELHRVSRLTVVFDDQLVDQPLFVLPKSSVDHVLIPIYVDARVLMEWEAF